MAKTKISDIIIPEIFNNYVIQRTSELSALFTSGIISRVSTGNDTLSRGGQLVHMPFWSDLIGEEEILSDSSPLTPDKISASQDVAVMHFRGKAWSVNELAKQIAGDDPMKSIADLVASFWARRLQSCLISTLAGSMGATTMSANVHDISAASGAAATISASTFLDAVQKMGDAKDRITAVAMHSAVENALAKADLIAYVQPSMSSPRLSLFMNKQVIVDDNLPVTAGVYTSYLFGEGAIGYDEGGILTPTEVARDALAGDDFLINRKAFVLHPRGVKWKTAAAATTPTNAQLAAIANWERVFEPKNVRIVQFKHKIA